MTSSANGTRAGLPFQILGGPHGHVPLHSSSGQIIGQLVGSGKLPLSIIDMADFEAGGLQRFFIDFAQALMRNAKGVVYLVIEEAHEFAPKERSGIGAENMAIHWAKKLATAGRSKGIRLIVATQRIQALHNAVLGSCETLIAHRLSAPADQEPVTKWLRANTDKATAEKVMGSLSSLPTGTGWICSGESKIFEMVKFPKFKTYDNAATPTGDSAEITVKTAPVDQDALREIIGNAVKEADANDPAKLKTKIRDLEKQLREKPTQVIETSALQKAKIDGYKEGMKAMQDDLRGRVKHAKQALDGIMDIEISAPKIEAHKVMTKTKFIPETKPTLQSDESIDLSGPANRIVESLIFWKSVGQNSPTRHQVSLVAGYAPSTGSFKNALSKLKVAGKINSGKGIVSLGFTPSKNAMDTDEAKNKMLSTLDGPNMRLINAFQNNGQILSREEIAEKSGYAVSTGSFKNALSRLSVLGIVERQGVGVIKLSDWAMELLS